MRQQSVERRTPPRVRCSTVLIIVAALSATLGAAAADAGPRRARMSSDLAAQLASGAAQVEVIVSGTPERVSQLAARHGGRVKKVMRSGAVLTLSAEAFNSLTSDPEVDAVSGDAVFRSHMAVTTAVTGA